MGREQLQLQVSRCRCLPAFSPTFSAGSLSRRSVALITFSSTIQLLHGELCATQGPLARARHSRPACAALRACRTCAREQRKRGRHLTCTEGHHCWLLYEHGMFIAFPSSCVVHLALLTIWTPFRFSQTTGPDTERWRGVSWHQAKCDHSHPSFKLSLQSNSATPLCAVLRAW